MAAQWAGIKTICFVEIDKFCQKVLLKHWPNVPIIEDVNNVEEIKAIVTAYFKMCGCVHGQHEKQPAKRGQQAQCNAGAGIESPVLSIANAKSSRINRINGNDKEQKERNDQFNSRNKLLLTAGFPCQPFSNAGRKRGANDDRYLWPATFRIIEAVRADWIILENVPGILGMVFPDSKAPVASQATLFNVENDEICDYNTISGGIERDLRQAGYETVWLVIPACSLGAPHRRDRVWIVANANRAGNGTSRSEVDGYRQAVIQESEQPQSEHIGQNSHASNATGIGQEQQAEIRELAGTRFTVNNAWAENWYEVATKFCRVDARIPDRVDRLKSLGNAIVPQVAYQIIKNITEIEKESK